VDPDANGEHDPIQRQEASLETHEAQALKFFLLNHEVREIPRAIQPRDFSSFSHGDFSQMIKKLNI